MGGRPAVDSAPAADHRRAAPPALHSPPDPRQGPVKPRRRVPAFPHPAAPVPDLGTRRDGRIYTLPEIVWCYSIKGLQNQLILLRLQASNLLSAT